MRRVVAVILLLLLSVLYGCGSSSKGGTTVRSGSVTGTASYGGAVPSGTTVTLVDSKGATRTTRVGTGGAFTIQVDGLAPPFVLSSYGLYSFGTAPGVININTLTTLCMEAALGIPRIDGNPYIPANFSTTFGNAVTKVKDALSGLYPPNVPATQTDFLNGNLVIDSGVDDVFRYISYAGPDANGKFLIGIGAQTILTGYAANGTVTVIPDSSVIATARATLFPSTTVSGKVTAGGTGVSGVRVTLAGNMTRTAQTDANGNYSYLMVPDGSYTVSAIKAGYTLSGSQTISVASQDVANLDFTATASSDTYTISGQVTANSSGLAGGAVTATSATASITFQTDANGNYNLSNLQNGTYLVSGALDGYVLSNPQSVTINGANVSGVDFTATCTTAPPATLGTYVGPAGYSFTASSVILTTPTGTEFAGSVTTPTGTVPVTSQTSGNGIVFTPDGTNVVIAVDATSSHPSFGFAGSSVDGTHYAGVLTISDVNGNLVHTNPQAVFTKQ